jgi:hypothetical protein
MKPYDLPSAEVVKILKDKGLLNLYHTNTVLTSNTFLENGHLLSRQYVEDKGLRQTGQYTDALDKKFGVYNSIFLDFVDIHSRARKRNNYGPILYVFATELISKIGIETVHITKRNPSTWADEDEITSRYYMSTEEFRGGYRTGNFGSMLILPDRKYLALLGNLLHVCFDNPNLVWNDNKKDLCDEAIEASKIAAEKGGLADKGIKILKRICDFRSCSCQNQYRYSLKTEEIFRIKT